VGTNQNYADGWEKAFSGKRGSAAGAKLAGKNTPKSAQKKAAPSKKASGKKTAKKGKK
jgi:hypothetical protein